MAFVEFDGVDEPEVIISAHYDLPRYRKVQGATFSLGQVIKIIGMRDAAELQICKHTVVAKDIPADPVTYELKLLMDVRLVHVKKEVEE